MKRLLWIFALSAMMWTGCGDDGVDRCSSPGDCADEGERCSNGLCVPDEGIPPRDASTDATEDASAEDGGADAAIQDSGAQDSATDGALDAAADSGSLDGSTDGGAEDGGEEDSGTIDGGAEDAGTDARPASCPALTGVYTVCDHASCPGASCYSEEVDIETVSRSPFLCGFRVVREGSSSAPRVEGEFGTDDGTNFAPNGISVNGESCTVIEWDRDATLQLTGCGRTCGASLVEL